MSTNEFLPRLSQGIRKCKALLNVTYYVNVMMMYIAHSRLNKTVTNNLLVNANTQHVHDSEKALVPCISVLSFRSIDIGTDLF